MRKKHVRCVFNTAQKELIQTDVTFSTKAKHWAMKGILNKGWGEDTWLRWVTVCFLHAEANRVKFIFSSEYSEMVSKCSLAKCPSLSFVVLLCISIVMAVWAGAIQTCSVFTQALFFSPNPFSSIFQFSPPCPLSTKALATKIKSKWKKIRYKDQFLFLDIVAINNESFVPHSSQPNRPRVWRLTPSLNLSWALSCHQDPGPVLWRLVARST